MIHTLTFIFLSSLIRFLIQNLLGHFLRWVFLCKMFKYDRTDLNFQTFFNFTEELFGVSCFSDLFYLYNVIYNLFR